MESRVLVFLLTLVLIAAGSSGCARNGLARADADQRPPVIEPDLERREVRAPRIDNENFEVGIFAGQVSIEDFGVNTVAGLRFAYHVTEGLFVEASAGRAEAGRTSFERLSGAAELLTDDERRYEYYNVNLGYNLFPGESFIGRRRAFNSTVYLIGGVGKTDFAGDDRFTLNLGLGLRMLPLDWLAVHADVRDHIFDIDLLGTQKRAHNLEFHVGVSFFF